MRRTLPFDSFGWLASALLLLGCWSAKDTALFADGNSANGAAGALGGATALQAGTNSGSGSESGGTRGDVGGVGASSSNAGRETGAGGATSDATPTGGSGGRDGQPVPVPVIQSCDELVDAITSEQNGHCYRVDLDELDFATAESSCQQAGGHLVTVSDSAENDLVRDLHDGEHWIGASDGRADRASGVGSYSWVDEEPWQYASWEGGQPNAHATDCPDEDGGANCYEHCAYQGDGGDWNDRSCWHTIASVCEWDVEGGAGGPDASGAAGAGP
jgi:hypothetical protein